ncbi:hypothetical protein F4679DRAFT_584308 [Xylaria curta]|nr:hypothetical protein F4679DRAFT_584308 [Xylaria curta]
MSSRDPTQGSGWSYAGVPDIPIISSQPNVQPNAEAPHPTFSEQNLFVGGNPILPNPVPQYGTPCAPNGHPFSMQGPPQAMFFPPVPTSSGPSAFYQSQRSGYMHDPINTHFSPSTVLTPITSFPSERVRQPSNPYIGQHFPSSGLNPAFSQTHARTNRSRNPNKRVAHYINNSSPSLTPKNPKRSRLQRECYGVSNPQPLQLGSPISNRSGNVGHEELSPNSSIPGGTGLTMSSRISINPIPTSLREISFQYHPIRAYEFRLVRLLPATMTMIKCEIIHAPLEAAPRYTAVSYT